MSIVIPVLNEIECIRRALTTIADFGRESGLDIELIIVNDGSTDGVETVVESFDDDAIEVRLINNDVNQGKGFSVRRGMMATTRDAALMSDADLSTPIDNVLKLAERLSDADVVIGSRNVSDSVISREQPWHRRFTGNLLRWLRGCLILRDLSDTQCGFKLFKRDVAHRAFELQTVRGFTFDIEVLAIARMLGYKIAEVGVTWRDHDDSRVRAVRDGIRMTLSLIKIWWRWAVCKTSRQQEIDNQP